MDNACAFCNSRQRVVTLRPSGTPLPDPIAEPDVGRYEIGEARAQAIQPHEVRPRGRDIGVAPGVLRPGALNAITDVDGVRVGHVTLVEGSGIRTGVTVILPHGGNLFQNKVPAGFAVGNGFGKFAGATQVEELGEIETPIVLTNTGPARRRVTALEPIPVIAEPSPRVSGECMGSGR